MDQPRFTVCGAGAAGTAIAADVALKGARVTLFELDGFADGIAEIRDRGGIELTEDSRTTSGRTGFAPLVSVTTDPAEALAEADGIMITCPAMNHGAMFEAIAPYFRAGHYVLFNTGYWASLRFSHRLEQLGMADAVTLCETNIMPYLSKRVGPSTTRIFNAKREMDFAAFPANRTDAALAVFAPAYGEYRRAESVLETNLISGGNQCIHVQLTIPVFGYIFDRFLGCRFYTEATEPFSRLSEGYDCERKPVAAALGFDAIETGLDWAKRAYGYEGRHLADAFRKSEHSDRYSSVESLERVLDEDIRYAFIPFVRIAEAIGCTASLTRGMVEVTGAMMGQDYWKDSVTLEHLGLNGFDAEGIRRYVGVGGGARTIVA